MNTKLSIKYKRNFICLENRIDLKIDLFMYDIIDNNILNSI